MPPDQEQLRCLLRAGLYRLLAEVRPETLPRCRRVRVRSGALAASLVIGPAAEVEQAQASASAATGQWLSPMESAIVLAIGTGTMVGKEIAAKARQPYSTEMKILIRNLHARGVLEHVSGQGYRRATQGDPA